MLTNTIIDEVMNFDNEVMASLELEFLMSPILCWKYFLEIETIINVLTMPTISLPVQITFFFERPIQMA